MGFRYFLFFVRKDIGILDVDRMDLEVDDRGMEMHERAFLNFRRYFAGFM